MQLHWLTVLESKSLILELQATNSINQIHLRLMLASITNEHQLFQCCMDHLITELDNRFEEGTAGNIGELVQILPSELVSSSIQLKPSHFKDVLQLYKDDLPSAKALHTELDLWRMKWKSESIKAKELDTPTKTLILVDKDYTFTYSLSYRLLCQ